MELETSPLKDESKLDHAQGMPQKVRQRSRNDCGVACLAMASGLSYEGAQAVFVSVGLSIKRGSKAAFSSNFKELQGALGKTGVPSQLQRFRGWHCVGQAAILKVFVKKNGNWHWVYAGRDLERGMFLHDPAVDLPSFENLPMDVMCLDFTAYQPTGCFINLQKRG